jgi:UDP-glucose 4-epimerase
MSNPIQGKKVLVTGAAGFIGYHVTKALLAAGASEVRGLDDLRCGSWRDFPEAAIRIERDLATMTNDDLVQQLRGVDILYHLAAEKYNSAMLRPESILQVNVDATYRLFAAAKKAGVGQIVFSSSLYAHGGTTLPPLKESDLPKPWTVYGISKLTGEHLLHHITRDGSVAGTSLRFFFVYGPRQYEGMGYKSVIVGNFERILRGERPKIFGTGTQTLDYIYVDDVVRAVILAASGVWAGRVMNIGTGQGISVNALTKNMLSVAGSMLETETCPPDWTDGTSRVADISAACSDGLWQPRVPIETGLRNVLEWMKRHA